MSGEWISPLNRSTAHINGTHIVPHLHTSKGAKNKEKNAYRTSNTDRPTQIAKKKYFITYRHKQAKFSILTYI